MELQIGPYQLTVPDAGPQAGAIRHANPMKGDSSTISIGPFAVSANLSDSSLNSWREFIGYTTKHQAVIDELEVNGIPGLTIRPGPLNDRRLDYVFQAPNCQSIEIIAWSDEPTIAPQREAVDRAVRTLQVSSGLAL